MNIVEKIKISKSFETPFFGLKRCLAVSMTYMHSDKTIFREKTSQVASLSLNSDTVDNVSMPRERFEADTVLDC